jgi:hypothetical protein
MNRWGDPINPTVPSRGICVMPKNFRSSIAVMSLQLLCAAALSMADDRIYRISDRHDVPLASASAHPSVMPREYPCHVCHDPGTPHKPLWTRPGDRDESWCPPIRYRQDDCFRSGWPHAVRKWATCSINPHYSAWYVGGGAAGAFPHARNRTCAEGTWGLDYSLWRSPKHVWMQWTPGREQGGLGAYQTDR